MKQYGLIGFPLTHSFSEAYFKTKFKKEHIGDCSYQNFPLEDIAHFASFINNNPGLKGLNVTIPHKEKVIRYLHEVDEVVNDIRACNCITISDNRLLGYNTDVVGFRNTLMEELMPHHTSALILGEGGAAKAVAYALRNIGIDYRHVVRTRKNPQHILFTELNESTIAESLLIINTTPVGTSPNVHESPIRQYQSIGPSHYLYDLIYNPSTTLFLQNGQKRGATIKNGLAMLEIQAEESWKIWTKSAL